MQVERNRVTHWAGHVLGILLVHALCQFAVAAEAEEEEKSATALSAVSAKLIGHVNQLYSQDALERLAAVEALRSTGSKATPASPFLVNLFADRTVVILPDQTVLGRHEVKIADAARAAIVAIGSGAIPVLRAAVKSSPDVNTRAHAARAMREIMFPGDGHGAAVTRYEMDHDCVAALLASMGDLDSRVRTYAAESLAHAGPDAISVLIKTLGDECEAVRLAAVKGIRQHKPKEAVSPLIPLLIQEGLRVEVQQTLGSIGAPAVEPLISAIAAKDCPYREAACWALSAIRDRDAAPILHRALRHKVPLVREWAANSLAGIGDAGSIGPLVESLADDDGKVRSAAAWALGNIRGEKGVAAEPLMKLLGGDGLWEVRKSAAWALGRMGSVDVRTRDAAIRALSDSAKADDNEVVRKTAQEAVMRLESK